MPRLPDLNSLGARPTPQSRRPIVSAAGGEVLGRAIQEAGQQLSQVAEQIQRDDDAQVVFEARRKLDDWERVNIFDPEKGAVAKRGRDAFDLPKTVPQSFDQFASELGANMRTPRQKQAFQEMAMSRRLQLTGWADRYALQQRTVFEEGQYQADIESFADRAAMYSTDPTVVATEAQMLRTRTIGFMRQRGASDEEIQQALLTNSTKLHAQVATAMLRRDPVSAKAYIDANKGSMDPVQFERLSAVADDAALDTEAKRSADSWAGMPMAEQLQKVAAIDDPKLREKTRLFVRQNQADIEAARSANERAVSDEVWQLVANGTPLNRLPPDLLAQMDGRERVAVNQHYQAEARRLREEAQGRSVKTDPGLFAQLWELPRDQFVAERLSKYVDRISQADMKVLLNRQDDMRAPEKQWDAATKDQQIRTAENLLGLTSKDQEKKGQFASMAYQAFDTFLTENKRAPSYAERQKILDDLTQEVAVPGFLWDSTKPAFLLTPKDQERIQRRAANETPAASAAPAPARIPMTQNINSGDRRLITQALRAEGIPVTEENIQRRYFEAGGGR
jgi:hypothetical protein